MTITAKIICDSISPDGIRLTTMQLRYPKFIHGEFLTHRVFSRNSSSSRAIPVERLIQDVIEDPVIPSFWGKNQKGMQADEECNTPVERYEDRSGSLARAVFGQTREQAWERARDQAIESAKAFSKAGYHKQIVNRLLEPFAHINTVVSATDWDNFFALRLHKDAQPEMQALAFAMSKELAISTPQELRPGQWHLPYIVPGEALRLSPPFQVSVARCARVSYVTHESKAAAEEEDIALFERLLHASPPHASPAEHQATPDTHDPRWNTNQSRSWWEHPHRHGNFRGWIQLRKLTMKEASEWRPPG